MSERARRWPAGRVETIRGVRFRTVKGDKSPDDVRLEWFVSGRWSPVYLDPVFAIVDAICENEDVLYPHPHRGGEETLDYLRTARIRGWEIALDRLRQARANKVERDRVQGRISDSEAAAQVRRIVDRRAAS